MAISTAKTDKTQDAGFKPSQSGTHNKGCFAKGKSGNPAGRPKGSGSRETQLRLLEEDALLLATNAVETISQTSKQALIGIGCPDLVPLLDAICDSVKDGVKEGKIGPSNVALLRACYDDLLESGQECEFFIHARLPDECDWETFKVHYTHRGRIDFDRHAQDLKCYPPIAMRIDELMTQRLLVADNT
jgi:hypothetical protein